MRGKVKELDTQASPPRSEKAAPIALAASFEEKAVAFRVGDHLTGELDIGRPVALN